MARQDTYKGHISGEDASGGEMVNKLDLQTYTSEFESHWVPHLFDLVSHRSKWQARLANLHE